ncbi:M48 family metallopeptidase [Dysgonomonas sp. ZJ709]|uniref:M48 family metallopeptidase n=1 Tax=Dysgonomonas sp. ZJ709 TaxID=2709797 RepID=UPI0013EDB237|nr:YgjP-like metallopeptidase domain-containing protein [Dysgonomonas sp. ZJ709]
MEIWDEDLGEIKLIKSNRAQQITVRAKNGALQLTHPHFVGLGAIEAAVREMKPRLLKLKEKSPPQLIFTPQTEFNAISFQLDLRENTCDNYYMKLKSGVLSITCPANCNFEDSEVQSNIRNAIEKALRFEAKRLFPQKVKELAQAHGFTYSDVKINKSRTRWGSCSSKKSINLSYFCMMIPEHLTDFVILHELCHTIEMNHGDRFWKLLDKVSAGRAKALTQELKSIKLNW